MGDVPFHVKFAFEVTHAPPLKNADFYQYQLMTAADPGVGFVGFGRTPLRPGEVVENARTAWLYQSSSVKDCTAVVQNLTLGRGK